MSRNNIVKTTSIFGNFEYALTYNNNYPTSYPLQNIFRMTGFPPASITYQNCIQ
jgi:hypothetical protein